jgi:CheY-like chemotaxis protein
MPHVNGIEATRQIVVKQRRLSIVIRSTYSDEAFAMRALEAGAPASCAIRLRAIPRWPENFALRWFAIALKNVMGAALILVA